MKLYGESPAQAGLAVAANLPSGMGGEASRAPGSPHELFAGQSSAGAIPRLTFINQTCLVPANANPPIPQTSTRLARLAPAPTPDRDARPPPEPNSSPHTKVTPTDFRPPKIDADAGFPYGSRFRSPEDVRPIQTPGFTLTIPLRLP
jgi:hypothetical protein